MRFITAGAGAQNSEARGRQRFLRSLLLGIAIGGACGLCFGWLQFPREHLDSRLSELAPRHQGDYIVMVAAAYASEGDLPAALERLGRLGIANPAAAVQALTERAIRTSSRPLQSIRLLVRLAAALGQQTPLMEPFLELSGAAP